MLAGALTEGATDEGADDVVEREGDVDVVTDDVVTDVGGCGGVEFEDPHEEMPHPTSAMIATMTKQPQPQPASAFSFGDSSDAPGAVAGGVDADDAAAVPAVRDEVDEGVFVRRDPAEIVFVS